MEAAGIEPCLQLIDIKLNQQFDILFVLQKVPLILMDVVGRSFA